MIDTVKSRRGVYYKQDASPYRLNAFGLVFVFSSIAKMRQFKSKVIKKNERFLNDRYKLYTQLGLDEYVIRIYDHCFVEVSAIEIFYKMVYKEVEPQWQPLKYRMPKSL